MLSTETLSKFWEQLVIRRRRRSPGCTQVIKHYPTTLLQEVLHFDLVIPIKNRWLIIFDWSVGQQSIFFWSWNFDHRFSIIQFWNDRIIDFFPIFLWLGLSMNRSSSNMQHWKSQKKNFSIVFLFIFCYCYWLYRLIDFLRQIDQSFSTDQSNFLIF